MKRWFLVILFGLFLVLLSYPAAAAPAAVQMDWYTPMTIAGGGHAISTNYSMNMSIGQSVIGGGESAGYKVVLGYWSGLGYLYHLLLPLLHR